MSVRQEVIQLLNELCSIRDVAGYAGATQTALDEFEESCRVRLPGEVRDWLGVCNGLAISPALYGVRPDRPHLDLSAMYAIYPEWKESRWVPLANDECGSYYVLDAQCQLGPTHPVYFLDKEDGYDPPSYIVASGCWQFIRFLLRSELIDEAAGLPWPFDELIMLTEDPLLVGYDGPVPFAWDLDG